MSSLPLPPQEDGTAPHSETESSFWTSRGKFPPAMEAAYQRDMERMRMQRIKKTGLAALLLYGAFAFSDRVMVPDVYHLAWAIRFLLIMPLMVLFTYGIDKVRSQTWRDALLAASVVVVGASLPWIAGLSRHPNALNYHTGVTLVVLFGNIVLGLRLRDAIITSTLMAAIYGVSLLSMAPLPTAMRLSSWLFYISAVVISLIANFRMDQDQRRAWLARTREHERNVELSRAVEQLAKLSAEDALTRIANRREFNRRLELEWGRAKREAQPLALVLVDVDCFKNFNDHYGHQAGDNCLQGIAAALRAIPQRSSDLVARFGGEEFVVLLPGTTLDDASQLAERMRQAILDLQIPHATSRVAPGVTASFGVAAMLPDAQAQSAALVAAADAALYDAKEQGRNRVAIHGQPAPSVPGLA